MKLKTGEYFIQEVFHSLRRNNWMTFASIGTVAVSLFVLGVFLILVLNMNRLAGMLESQVQISVYLEDHLTDREKRQIGYDIESLQGIDSVTYVDRETAKERLKERLGDQKYLLDALSEDNPLPDAFEVTVTTPSVVESAAGAIAAMQGVEEAKYGQDVVEHLFDITRLMRIFGFVLMGLLGGATDWFIRWPFLLEGIVLGCIGGFIAAVALRSFYAAMAAKIYSTLAFFPLMPQYPFMNYVTLAILLAGIVIGAIGSVISLKRFLRV